MSTDEDRDHDRVVERLVDDADQGRFELYRGPTLVGWLYYSRLRPNRYALRHTEVDPHHRGSGVAGAMASRVLEEIRARAGTVTAICPFVAGFLAKSSAYDDLVDPRFPGYPDRASAEAAQSDARR